MAEVKGRRIELEHSVDTDEGDGPSIAQADG